MLHSQSSYQDTHVHVAEQGALISAELLVSHVFSQKTWRRPLCLRAFTSVGEGVAVLDDGVDDSFAGGRCEGGKVIATWQISEAKHNTVLVEQLEAARGNYEGFSAARGAELEQEACRSSAALAAWHQLAGYSLSDPDSIRAVQEYFPLGPLTQHSRSFLRVRLAEADLEGDEVFILRPEAVENCVYPAPIPFLFRPVSSWKKWCWSILKVAPPPTRLAGVCVLKDDQAMPGFSLSALRDIACSAGAGSGFLPGTPWAEAWRVHRVEEHCRNAHLGLWGWVLRLKHSVLAVHIQRRGGTNDLARDKEDLLYLDKNADIGVGWRRAGFREHFSEVPRLHHSFALNLRIQDFWSAVVATSAFAEAQETSNCQHFVREVFAELAERGHMGAATGGVDKFTLRNQGLADVLRAGGYLDEGFKAAPGSERGRQAWQLFMSWGCKVRAARLLTPWVERFNLQPAAMV